MDFAYKQKQRSGEGWALRTAKLRLSRKLTYAAGLAICFKCANDQQADADTQARVEYLHGLCRMTPLDLLVSVLGGREDLCETAQRLFGAYDQFLQLLNDQSKRAHLEELAPNEAESDSLFKEVREWGHRFQDALTHLFLEDNSSGLYKLTKVYGVF